MASQSTKKNMDNLLSPHSLRTKAIYEGMDYNFPTVLTDMIEEYTRPIIVSGSSDKALRVWNIKSLVTKPFEYGTSRLEKKSVSKFWKDTLAMCVCVTKMSEDIVVSGSWDEIIRVWKWKE